MYANAALLSKLIGFKHFYPSKTIHLPYLIMINLFFFKVFYCYLIFSFF